MQPTEERVSGRTHEPDALPELTARIEPFDPFWEGPEDVEKGYRTFYEFYRRNYISHVPGNRDATILVISCGPGYFVDTLVRHGYRNVIGIDSDATKVAHARRRDLDCRTARAARLSCHPITGILPLWEMMCSFLILPIIP